MSLAGLDALCTGAKNLALLTCICLICILPYHKPHSVRLHQNVPLKA